MSKKWDKNKKNMMQSLFDEYDWEDICKRCKEIIRILGHDIPIAAKEREYEKEDDD